MNQTTVALSVAGALSAGAVSTFAWHLGQLDAGSPERLVAELRLARWAAVLLAAVGSLWIGLAVGARESVVVNPDVAIGMVVVGLAGVLLQREPREALQFLSGAFVLHALVSLSHRPGWLAADLAPRWFIVGCAVYDVWLAALCFWTQRR